MAAALDRSLGLPLVARPLQEAAAHVGLLDDLFALDCPCSSARTREQDGWAHGELGRLDDLNRSGYFAD